MIETRGKECSLASADVRGGERLRDLPKEFLRRRLYRNCKVFLLEAVFFLFSMTHGGKQSQNIFTFNQWCIYHLSPSCQVSHGAKLYSKLVIVIGLTGVQGGKF